jgi:hypothetical protein
MVAGFFVACWIVVLLHYSGVVSVAGGLALGIHALYGLAATLGWLAGNVYVGMRRVRPERPRGPLLVLTWLGPPSVPALLRAMAPVEWQLAAPLVAVWGFGVQTVFFLVPVVLARLSPLPPSPRRRD